MKYLCPIKKSELTAAALLASFLFGMPSTSFAVDGCKIILCLGGNWRAISTCIPDVRWAMRHGIPSCAGLEISWAGTENCPPQYTVETPGVEGAVITCRMTAAINVLRSNQLWQQVWWSEPEQIYRIWYSDAAKAEIADFDPAWDNDYAVWLALQPSAPDAGPGPVGH